MATTQIYHSEGDRVYTVSTTIKKAIMDSIYPSYGADFNKAGLESNGEEVGPLFGEEVFLELTTNIPAVDGSSQNTRVTIKNLANTAPDVGGSATDFQDLVTGWIDYYMLQGELGQSSTSSSSSSSSSLEHSSSSSSG